MQKLVSDFMHQSHKLFGLRLARQKSDLSAVAHAKRGRDVLGVIERDTLPRKELDEPVPMLPHVACDVVLELGQVRAFGLRHIEDVHCAEANQDGARLFLRLLFLIVLLAPVADNRGQNLDALLASFDEPAQLFPR